MKRPSPATVIALLALIVALGGTATTARNAIDSSDVANNSLRGVDVRNGTLGSPDVKNNSLRGVDIKNRSIGPRDLARNALAGAIAGATGPQGPQGGPGPQGPTGPAGSAAAYARINGLAGTIDVTRSSNVAQANFAKSSAGVYCIGGLAFTPKNAFTALAAAIGGTSVAAGTTTSALCTGLGLAGPHVLVTVEDGGGTDVDGNVNVWIED